MNYKKAGHPEKLLDVRPFYAIIQPSPQKPANTLMIRSLISILLLLCGALAAQSGSAASRGAPMTSQGSPSQSKAAATGERPRYRPDRFAGRAGTYYKLVWGVEKLSVKSTEAGAVIRFTYEVLDAQKANMLNDKRLEPSLIDEQAHVKLIVPTMDKVGKLRQTASPEAGKIYWMLFSNKGGYVKRGDRVSIVIGDFRADGLVVD